MDTFLNLFSLKCCQNQSQDNEFGLEINPTNQSSLQFSEYNEIKDLKTALTKKLCLFTIYSNMNDLIPFNEVKKETQIDLLLTQKYLEIYKKNLDKLSQNITELFQLKDFNVITMILFLENNELKILDMLKNEKVTRHNIKKILLIYQYQLYRPPSEPEKNDPNGCEITFRFVDSDPVIRRFPKNTKIVDLYKFIKSTNPWLKFKLYKISPSEELRNLENTLKNDNFGNSVIIQVLT